jgi:hypothetical protein
MVSNFGFFKHGNGPAGSMKGRKIYLLAKKLSASRDALCSMELYANMKIISVHNFYLSFVVTGMVTIGGTFHA